MNASLEQKNIVGLVYFFIILDNEGKRLYSKYYVPESNELFKIQAQKDFEKKICHSVINFNVNRNDEIDIFNLNEYVLISKINKEVAFFIGAHESDNESIISNFFEVLLETLENVCNKNVNRKGILDNYQNVVTLVDEMIDNGIIINTDGENLEDKVFMKEKDEGKSYFGSLIKSATFGLRSAMGGK
mmetsp:Transcript_322/g.309  ORF Transcript_322/g.309 Transcript_322/m.309 type:complete len:187 (+) Transcript_322:3-563(+)